MWSAFLFITEIFMIVLLINHSIFERRVRGSTQTGHKENPCHLSMIIVRMLMENSLWEIWKAITSNMYICPQTEKKLSVCKWQKSQNLNLNN